MESKLLPSLDSVAPVMTALKGADDDDSSGDEDDEEEEEDCASEDDEDEDGEEEESKEEKRPAKAEVVEVIATARLMSKKEKRQLKKKQQKAKKKKKATVAAAAAKRPTLKRKPNGEDANDTHEESATTGTMTTDVIATKTKKQKKHKPESVTDHLVFGELFRHQFAMALDDFRRASSLEQLARSPDLDGFVQVDPLQIRMCKGATLREGEIQTAAEHILTRSLLGKVKFSHFSNTDPVGRDMSDIYTDFARKARACMWEIGFVPVIVNPSTTPGIHCKPEVLPLHLVDVWYHETLSGARAFVYTKRSDGPAGASASYGRGSSSFNPVIGTVNRMLHHDGSASLRSVAGLGRGPFGDREIIPDVVTFVDKPPDPEGKLQSTVMACRFVMAETHMRSQTRMIAESNRARPPYIVQRVEAQPYQSSVSGLMHYREPLEDPYDDEQKLNAMRAEQSAYQRADFEQARGIGAPKLVQEELLKLRAATRQGASSVAQRIDIHGKGVEHKQATMPEAPVDMEPQYERCRNDIHMIFGIPPGYISVTSSGRGGDTEVRKETFQDKLRCENELLVKLCQDVYRFGNDTNNLAAYTLKHAPGRGTEEGLAAALKVRVSIGGTPPWEVAKEMLLTGLYKPKAFIDMACATYLMDPSDFQIPSDKRLLLGNSIEAKPKVKPAAKKKKPKAKKKAKSKK